MGKHSSVDIYKSNNSFAPESDFIRIKGGRDNKIYFILDNGDEYFISSPWELPVISQTVIDPSTITPVINDKYIIPINATGDWVGQDSNIANWNGTVWEFITPEKSWVTYIQDTNLLAGFDGNEWKLMSVPTDEMTLEVLNDEITILGIDTIINSNGVSLDPSHTPMSNPDAELVTRGFVDSISTSVDYATIDLIPALPKMGVCNSERDLYHEAWNPKIFTNMTGVGMHDDPLNGVVYIPKNMTTLLYCYTSPPSPVPAVDNTPILDPGTYRLYSNIDLVPYGLNMTENVLYSGARSINFTSRFEQGRWLHEAVVPWSDFRLSRVLVNTGHPMFFYQLILYDGYPGTNTDITITGIDRIINADKWSVDGFITKAIPENANNELATRKYIDNTKNNPDNITLEVNTDNNIICSNENDIQLVLNDAYGHNIATHGYHWVTTTPGVPTLTNGTLELNLPDDGSGFCQAYQGQVFIGDSNNAGINEETWNAYVHTNMDVRIDGINFWLYTNNYELEVDEVIELSDGSFLLRSMVPKGEYKEILGCWARIESSTVNITNQPWYRFVDCNHYPPKQIIKVKEIDLIIDDDDESIDGSDTPMSDAHHELVTRAKVESLVNNNTHWNKSGTELNPSDALVDVINLEMTQNGYTQIKIRNNNDTGNGAGALLELKGSGADYTNNAYFGIYSPAFWLSQLAGKAVLMSDRDVVIGTVDSTGDINFLIGNSYSSPVVVGHLNQDGFHLDALQTTSVHPASYYNLFVDASTGLIYASNTGATGNTPATETFTIDATIVTNGYIDLSNAPNPDNHNSVNWNGTILFEGATEDYTITGNRVTFHTSNGGVELITGMKIQIKYKY